MDMPDLKPTPAPSGTARKVILACVAAFILLAFAFAFLINLPDWR